MWKYILISSIFLLLSNFSVTGQTDKLLVLVNSHIYSSLKFEIDRYADDIGIGYTVELYETSGGTPQNLRNFIISQSNNLVGCIFIGSMPDFIFEIEYDVIARHYTSFPCDLFYIDLDGAWSDEDSDGLYDSHIPGMGDVAPEIFLGRIDASRFSQNGEDQIEDLRGYFNRDHNYWSGAYSFRKTGLTYSDEDWKYDMNVNGGMPELYGQNNFLLFTDERVRAEDYINNRLENDQYEFIQVAVHSDENTHYFNVDGVYPKTISSDEIRNTSLKALGYNLFACSACDYTRDNFLGGAYIFNNSEKSLVAVGSTKIGSMLQFYAFYNPLGENKPIGQAFKEWFDFIAPYNDYSRAWHYGMTIIGDPMVKFNCGDSNHGPLADIGSNRRVLWPDTSIQINASIKDDGLPAGLQVTQLWEKISGPGDVLFDNKDAPSTSMNISSTGDYRIKLTATDGEYVSEDFTDIKVCHIKWIGETSPSDGIVMGIKVRDSLAFLSSNRKLEIINVKNKANPYLIGSKEFQVPLMIDPYYSNLDIDSNFAYVVLSENGLHIFNISDGYNPYETGSFEMQDNLEKVNDVKVTGDYAYVSSNTRGLMVLDIHDRTAPELIGYCPTDGSADALSIQGDYAFIADGSNGLRIIDISDKSHPEEIGHFNDAYDHTYFRQGIQVLGKYAYISYNDYDRFYWISIIDISDKTNPFEVSHLDNMHKGFYVEGNYLYYFGTADYDVLGIFDITDKSNPTLIESYKRDEVYFQNPMNFFKSGSYLYMSDNVNINGLNILQVGLDNTCPYVYAGDDRNTFRSRISLQGMASDDNLPGGSSLSWYWQKISGPGDVSFINPDKVNTEVHFSDSGTYVLQLSVFDGDLTGNDDIRIINFSGPPKSNNVAVCAGDSVPGLTASGDSIRWYSDLQLTGLLYAGDTLATGKTFPGLYTYYVTQTIEGIESDYSRVDLSITPLPAIIMGKDTTITRDQHIILGPYSDRNIYLWNDGSGNPYFEFSANEIGPGNHIISVLVTDTNTCSYSDSLAVSVVFPTNTGNTITGSELAIFPNPADNVLNIKISEFHAEDIRVNVYNQEGELLKYTETCTDQAGNAMPVDISGLPPGMYYIKLVTRTKQFVGKFIIQ